jgi:demethylmacrocin O-methyltransferase
MESLINIAKKYNTDKFGIHNYITHYENHFKSFRNKNINMFEIGVGGYHNPNEGGGSLKMWKEYFSNGNIYSIDIYDKSPLQEDRIKIFRGSQIDINLLNDICEQSNGFDIIIDDGSHINSHVIESFNFLFTKLKDGGIYVIEDTQTSYWKSFGGDYSKSNPNTTMNYFKNLTDCLNNKEFIFPNYQQSYFDKKIISIHFYHNLIFIYKGDNDEESNVIKNNMGDY